MYVYNCACPYTCTYAYVYTPIRMHVYTHTYYMCIIVYSICT